ncbi:MAG: DUF885 domain-containing protein [Elusimicrobia bacterium]|nr:DUF885 domain-containing protein [Elusimicrobiota bacterium]
MTEFPEWATSVGYPGQNGRWTDRSLEAAARRKRETEAPLKAVRAIDRSKLTPEDALNYDLFKYQAEIAFDGRVFDDELLPINQRRGVQQNLAMTLDSSPAATVRDYEDVLQRLRGVSAAVDQTIALLKEGLKKGITPSKDTLADVDHQFEAYVGDPQASPLMKPFKEMPAAISSADQARLRAEAAKILADDAAAAYRRLREYFAKEYYPKCRATHGWSALPNGKTWYEFKVRDNTTTRLSAKEIHALGLLEVKRIRAEMDKARAETGFAGTFEEFKVYLRTDPKFYYASADELLAGYRDIAKRIDPELIKVFGRLPRLPYGVRPVPAFSEKSQTTAYYMRGSPNAGRPGYFFANTYDLKTRPKWEMEALTAHEAVPGHHLQISLAQETDDLPEFRKYSGPTAYVEGWGLYSESLGAELGLYKDPHSRFGQLVYEMWRACRLVVDTGLHSMGWSRQKAIDYFLENTSKTSHDIEVEIDRYINTPGQALAYKLGELKFKELKAHAKAELGDRYDVRAFHDAVLALGAVPLEILESQMKAWVAARKAAR